VASFEESPKTAPHGAAKDDPQRLRAMLDAAPVLASYVDRNERYGFVNRRYEAWFGVSCDAAVGKRVREVIGETNYVSCAPRIAEALQGVPQDFDFLFEDRSGGNRWVHAIYTPQFDDAGGVAGFVARVEDITSKRQAETALAEREAFLNQAAAMSKIGFFIWDDENGGCQYCSEQLAAMWGVTVEQYKDAIRTDQMILERIHPEDRARVREIYDTTTRQPARYSIEFRAYDAQGQLRYFRESGQGTCDADGRIHRVIGTVMDLTERRLTETALRQTAERLAEAQRIGSMGNWEWVIETGDIRWSDQVYRLFGFEPQSFRATYEGFLARVHPDDREAVMAAVQSALDDGSHYRIDHRIILPDRRIRMVREQGEAFYDSDGRPRRMVGTVQDINDLVEAEMEATRQAEHARAVMEHVADGVITIDSRGIIRDFNPAAVATFGYAADEAIGRNVNLLMPEPHQDAHDGFIAQLVTTGRRRIIGVGPREVLGQHKDGSVFPMELAVSEAMIGGERLFIGVTRDISLRKRTEAQLQQAQKMEAVGQLTGGIAHDFNNLLGVVLGNLELIDEGLDDGSKLKGLAAQALAAADRGAALTGRLLAFSRQKALQPKAANLNHSTETMVELIRRALGETIDVRIATAADLWDCEVDSAQLESALLNLAVNARDAMPNGGSLCIETENVDLTDELVAVQVGVPPAHYIALSVGDSGSGIPKEILPRVFDPFFTTKEVGKGSGLGLAMVYGFVRQSGGGVRIYSEPGRGTMVKLYFPRARADAEPNPAHAADDGEPRGRGEVVLVVEDDADLRTLAVAHLEALGYERRAAATAAAALEVLRGDERISLLLTDVVLPGGMSGAELAIEAQKMRPGLRVLFMSGFARNVFTDLGIRETDVALLQKPFRRNELARKVREALGMAA